MDNRVKEELITLEYNKKKYTEKLEEAKAEVIKIIEKAKAIDIIDLELKYCAFNDLKRYAQELHEIDVKLRTINYVVDCLIEV
jgi:hypothetical protein